MTFPGPVQMVTVGGTSGTGKTVGAADGWEPPLAGNSVYVLMAHSSRTADMSVPAGYSTLPPNAGAGPGTRPITGGFVKTADGSESSIDVNWDTSGQWCAVVLEFDADDIDVVVPLTANGGNGSGLTSLSSDSTISVLGFALALFASSAQNGETPSYTNGFTHFVTALAGGSGDLALDVAVGSGNVDSAGSYETTATWVSSENRAAMCLPCGLYVNPDGESLQDYQRSSLYRVTNLNGDVAYVDGPGNGIALTGLNRGQAKKHLKSMVGQFNLQVEP